MARIIIIILIINLFWINTILQKKLMQISKKHGLINDTTIKNSTPLLSFSTIVLGGFRSLIADFLYLRSLRMQEEERYFEMVQLSSWIVQLQPSFSGASISLAHNFAFNIATTFNKPQGRWRWIQKGIELLRDETLEYNKDPNLYFWIAWIYYFKIGHYLDSSHKYYKKQLAEDISTVLGRAPRFDWQALAATPQTKDGLYQQLGSKAETLNSILTVHSLTLEKLEHQFRQTGTLPPNIKIILNIETILSPIQRYFRKRWLQEGYKLDVQFINELIETYGYLDFRLPEAHAIYWCQQGLLQANQHKFIKCQRLILHSLHSILRKGELVYITPESSQYYNIKTRLDLLDVTIKTYEQALENYPEYHVSLLASYENFLKDAIVLLYISGDEKKAKDTLDGLRRIFPDKPVYKRPVASFAFPELANDLKTINPGQLSAIIYNFIHLYYRSLQDGDKKRAVKIRRKYHELYHDYHRSIPEKERQRISLSSLKHMEKSALQYRLREIDKLLISQEIKDRLKEQLKHTPTP